MTAHHWNIMCQKCEGNCGLWVLKGKLISKWFMRSSISSKKRTNEFVFTSMRIVFVRFLEEIDDLKKPFRNLLTFTVCDFTISILKSTQCLFVCLSFYLTPFPWINLRAKYIYGFFLTRRRYSDHFKVNIWEFV